MKKIHPLTTAGIGMGTAAAALLFSGYQPVACALALMAYFFTLPEVPKYSSPYQFVFFLAQGALLGYTLDFGQYRFPFFTVILFLVALTPLLRLIFYKPMLHARYLWVEPPLVLIILAGWLITNLIYPQGWQTWFYPLPPIGFTIYLIVIFLIEGRDLLRVAKAAGNTRVGMPAPDFELPDQSGQMVRLSAFLGARHVLLIFLRGDWCPSCHVMLRTYEKSSEKLRDKKILLLAIGPDDLGTNRQMAERIGVEFRILSDVKQEAAIAYGTHLEKDPTNRSGYGAGLPIPSAFIICDQGIIRYHSRADQAGEFLNPRMVFDVLENIPAETR
ncbi:MAG: thiol-specific antioxidant protein [Bacteroidetes bacterium]|nr:MAG: thiol-specific antioxidant protein [Bacteroidota bacterium]